MLEVDDNIVAREALALARSYGVDELGSEQQARYQDWRCAEEKPNSSIDRVLLAAAAKGGFRLRLASVYAGRFRRLSALRRCEVTMLAILECHAESAIKIDSSADVGPLGAWWRYLFWGAGETLLLMIAVLRYTPTHLLGSRL